MLDNADSAFSSQERGFIYLFLDGGEEQEKERERSISVWLPLTHPLLGTWPATQALALTGNRTRDPLVCRPVLNPLSQPGQEWEVLGEARGSVFRPAFLPKGQEFQGVPLMLI